MSEVESRSAPARGRARGRGGFRGGRGGRNGAAPSIEAVPAASIDEDPELSQLKKKFGSSVATIKEMFPTWTDEDVLGALQETDGNLEVTVERIADGKFGLTNTQASSVL